MPFRSMTRRAIAPAALVLLLCGSVLGFVSLMSRTSAQEGPAAAPADDLASPKAAAKLRKPRHVVRKPKVDETAAAAPAAAPPEAPRQVDFAAELDKAGATVCHAQINALATSTMGEVVGFNTISNWAPDSGDKRAVSMAIGQRYASGSKVPFGVTQIVSVPNQQGKCDGFVTQIVPSPLSCARLRESIAARGRQIGDLAGIALLQDAMGRSMLIPTGADTCVLVTNRSVYVK